MAHGLLRAALTLTAWLCVASAFAAGAAEADTTDAVDGSSAAELTIRGDGTAVVTGLGDAAARTRAAALAEEDLRRMLTVVACDPERSATAGDLPALLGTHAFDGTALQFTPRFPPAPGLVLDATFHGDRWRQATGAEISPRPVTASVRIPASTAEPSTRVEAVRPDLDVVPSNLLRLYVHFSAPMSARHVLPHVELLGADGRPVETAFVEVEGGLWDPERTRLTLFVHPGRVKRGVGPNQALGPVLEEGETYRLRIGREARDALGLPLAAAHEHTFRVGPPDRTSPDPARWTLTPPASPDGALLVQLAEPADTALLRRLPTVVDESGTPIPGRLAVADDGASFEFRPASPWAAGVYELRVPSALEDPSGHRVDRLFEEAPPEGDAAPASSPSSPSSSPQSSSSSSRSLRFLVTAVER